MIETALYYIDKGWPIFPLVPGGKVPLIPKRESGRGCHDATTDRARVENWWTRYPDANVGIATGRGSGLIVIDIDMKDGRDGAASIRTLEPRPTFTVRTPSRGFHLYYQMPVGERITIGTDVLPGVDFRGDAGYVVGPGSRTEQGWYLIARALPIAPLPANILALVAKSNVVPLPPLAQSSPGKWHRDRQGVAAALAFVDPCDYDTWITIGAAIHLACSGSDDGYALWQAWSEGGLTGELPANYASAEDCRKRWGSFGNANRDPKWRPVTLGTLFRLAKLRGFEGSSAQEAG